MRIFFSLLALLMGLVLQTARQLPAPARGNVRYARMEGEKKSETTLGQETSPNRSFLLEGVKASFSIMAMAEHKKMLKDMKMKVEVDPQATHNIAVTLTDTRSNQPIKDVVVKMKVIGPKGKEEIKVLDPIPAMNQYAGDFTLREKGGTRS